MMKIVGAWPSDICACFKEETENTLHVLKWKHPEMLEVFEKET